MENASHALIIAATVLLGMMIMSVMINLFRAGAEMNKNYDEKQTQEALQLYNSKFEKYNNENNSIMDLISVCNLAYDTNIDTNYDEGWAVGIVINCGTTTFRIPNTTIGVPSDYQRNSILNGATNGVISIFDLSECTISNLAIENIPPSLPSGIAMNPADTLSLVEFDFAHQKNEYKYLFSCDTIDYNLQTQRVSSMVFNARINNELADN